MRRRTLASVAATIPFAIPLLLAARPPAAGSIEGTLKLEQKPGMVMTDEYSGSGGPHPIPPIPAVAFLEGKIPGGAARQPPRLEQRDTSFHPQVLVVQVGTTVEFPNSDPFFHNVFSYSSAARFDLGRYPRGESRSVTFEKTGLVKVFCEVHKWMRAAVVVTENPYHTVVPESGRFRIDGVPPGRYKLSVWHFDKRKKTVDVTVPDGGTARVALEL